MARVEFHCHTSYSKDCLLSPRQLVDCCVRKGIDRVVVTDHNTIGGAMEAQAIDPGRVIVGEEIMTTQGELLAAFLTSEVPAGLSPTTTIEHLRRQGAFISVAHPFDAHRKGAWSEGDLLAVLPYVDAIEVFNSRCMNPAHNRLAAEFARRHGVAGTVGSDAHTCWEIGRSVLLVPPFSTGNELRLGLSRVGSETRWSPPWIHLASRYASLYKKAAQRLDGGIGA